MNKDVIKYAENPMVGFVNHGHPNVTWETVCSGWLGFKIPWSFRTMKILEDSLGIGAKLFGKEQYRYYHNLLDHFNNDMETNLKEYLALYPGSVVTCLIMDTTVSVKGKLIKSVSQVTAELCNLRDKYKGRVLVGVGLDPNNPDMYDNFLFAVERGIDCVKIYPCEGYLPTHPRLMNIYKICETNGIPVIAHCSSGTINNQNKRVHVVGLREFNGQITPEEYDIINLKKADLQRLNHPNNWNPIGVMFPNLKVQLAHFNGVPEWKDAMIAISRRFKGFYLDTSYSLWQPGYADLLHETIKQYPEMINKFVYGDDWPCVLIEGDLETIRHKFQYELGQELWDIIFKVNPRKFWGI